MRSCGKSAAVDDAIPILPCHRYTSRLMSRCSSKPIRHNGACRHSTAGTLTSGGMSTADCILAGALKKATYVTVTHGKPATAVQATPRRVHDISVDADDFVQ